MGLYTQRSATPNKRGCFLYGVIAFVIMPILLCGGALVLFIGRENAANRQLNAEKNRLYDLGLPADNATMKSYHDSLTSSEDTAGWLELIDKVQTDEFKASYAGVPILSSDAGEIPKRWTLEEPTDWPEEQNTRDFLRLWQSLIDDLETLASKQNEPDAKPVRMPIKFDSFLTLLPQTQEMRQLARVLMIRGETAVFDRDSAQVRRSVESLFGCAHALDGEPILVSQLVGMAIDAMALSLLKQAIEYDVLTEEDMLGLLKHVLKKTDIDATWKRAWHGERAMALPVFENPDLIGQTTPGGMSLPLRSRDALNYLETISGILEVPTDDLNTLSDGLQTEEAKLQARMAGGYLERFDNVMTSLISPAIVSGGNAFIRDAMSHRLAAQAIATRIYEKREGRLPDAMEALEGYTLDGVPLDLARLAPLGKQPFGYRLNDRGAVLWGFDPQARAEVPVELETLTAETNFQGQTEPWIWKIPASPSSRD